MKDRDLIAQMAAALYPHVHDLNFAVSKEVLAVNTAMKILKELDSRRQQPETFKKTK